MVCKSNTLEGLYRTTNTLLRYVKKHKLTGFEISLNTIVNWQREICNSITNKNYSNAISVGVILLIKQIKMNARGYQNLKRSLKLIQLKNNKKYKIQY